VNLQGGNDQGNSRDEGWRLPAHRVMLFFFFLIWKGFQANALPANSSAGTKSCFLRSTPSM